MIHEEPNMCHVISNEVRDGIAQTKPQTKPFGFTAVQQKISTSWFKGAKKHCMQCGTASTKVHRAACKSCGSIFWNLQAVSASEVHYLGSLKAPLSSLKAHFEGVAASEVH